MALNFSIVKLISLCQLSTSPSSLTSYPGLPITFFRTKNNLLGTNLSHVYYCNAIFTPLKSITCRQREIATWELRQHPTPCGVKSVPCVWVHTENWPRKGKTKVIERVNNTHIKGNTQRAGSITQDFKFHCFYFLWWSIRFITGPFEFRKRSNNHHFNLSMKRKGVQESNIVFWLFLAQVYFIDEFEFKILSYLIFRIGWKINTICFNSFHEDWY